MRKMCGVEQERGPNGKVRNSYTYEIRFPQKEKRKAVPTGPRMMSRIEMSSIQSGM